MSDLDVALRLRLERRGFAEGERDLKDLQRAAAQFGARDFGKRLSGDLASVRKEARSAESAFGTATAEVRSLNRQQLDRLRLQLGDTTTAARRLKAGIDVAGDEAGDLNRRQLNRFREQIGSTSSAVDKLKTKLRETGEISPGVRRTGEAAAFLSTSANSALAALAGFAAPTAILIGMDRLADKFREIDRLAVKVALTAEARDPATSRRVLEENKTLGRDIGVLQQPVSAARQALTSAGISLADQSTLLPPTLRAAVGAGAAPETMAQAGVAYVQSLRGKPEEIGKAYDMMAKGGKLGAFEIEAMARNLPQLGTAYQALGGTGLQSISELTSMAQIVRKGAGSEDEAANNLYNYLQKLSSPETVKNFKDQGVDLREVFDKARSQGQHPALAVLDQVTKLTGGDTFKMGELFGDQQVLSALLPMIQNRKELETLQKQIYGGSAGTSDLDYKATMASPAGREDLEKARREAAQVTLGQNLEPGASFASRATTRMTEDAARISSKGLLGGAWDFYKMINPIVGGDFGLAGRYLNEPEAGTDEIDAKTGEIEALLQYIEKQRAGIAASPNSLNWGRESKIAIRQNRIREIVGSLKSDLASAEEDRPGPGEAPTLDSQALELRIDALTKALRDLEDRLKGTEGAASPISFGSSSGEARVINASLGGRGSGSGGGNFQGTYGSGPVMDGFGGASAPGGIPPGAEALLPGGVSAKATKNPGGAAGELFDVFSATGFNDAQSVALLGHAEQESGFNGKAWNAGEGAGGILQWRGNRLANLKAFAAEKGMDWQDRSVQGAFVRHEMENDPYERERSKQFRSATTVEGASAALKDYIRFGDNSGGTRLSNARKYAGQFGLSGGTQAGAAAFGAKVGYANSGATRNRPVTPELFEQIQRGVAAVYGEGYSAEIYSGGQGEKGSGLARVGSTRHDDHGRGGMAADLYVMGPDGKRVTGDELAKLGQHWAATGQGGVGMEMRGGGIHLDEHKDRAKSWNYAGKGGRYTRGQAAIMAKGLQGIPPEYANPGALNPAAVAEARERILGPADGYDDDGFAKSTKASRPVPSWKQLTREPQPGAGAGPGRAPSGPARDQRPVTIHQNFTGTDPGLQARRSQREQGRAIRMAEARSLHDTALPIA